MKNKNWLLYIAILGGLGFIPFMSESPKQNNFSNFIIISMLIGLLWLIIWLLVWIRYTSFVNYKNNIKNGVSNK